MFKNRTFLIGLGAGLILGSLLLQIMTMGNSVQTFTKERLQQEAEKLDLKLVPTDEPLYTQEQLDLQLKQHEEKLKAVPPTQPQPQSQTTIQPQSLNDANAQEHGSVKGDASPANETKSTDTSKQSASTEPKLVKLKISPGMNLKKVSEELERLGLVKNAESFIKYGTKNKINTKIRSGQYDLHADASMGEIVKIITTKPKS